MKTIKEVFVKAVLNLKKEIESGDFVKRFRSIDELMNQPYRDLTHRERCWINYFESEVGTCERWNSKSLTANGIRRNDFYTVPKKPIREDEFEKIKGELTPEALKRAQAFISKPKK